MAFKETRGNMTVEACVMPAPGGMYKGYVRVAKRISATKVLGQTTGRGCGRPMAKKEDALAAAELEARRIIGL
ncbi:hypothetical protein PSP31120_03715 [Pandoraea sputorum]|nr:hypothetical protein PSP31120_03715 [Pandoraea sputorum]